MDKKKVHIEGCLELDKVEISLPLSPQQETPSVLPEKVTFPAAQKKSRGVFVYAILITISTLFLVGIAVWFITSGYSNIDPTKGFYLTIGPIYSSTGRINKVTLVLDIHFSDYTLKDTMQAKKDFFKVKILDVMEMEAVEKMILAKDYDTLRRNFKEELNRSLKAEYIDDIYFSKILVK